MIARSTVSTERIPIFFLANGEQAAMRHSGLETSFGQIIAVSPGSTHHVALPAIIKGSPIWLYLPVRQFTTSVRGAIADRTRREIGSIDANQASYYRLCRIRQAWLAISRSGVAILYAQTGFEKTYSGRPRQRYRH